MDIEYEARTDYLYIKVIDQFSLDESRTAIPQAFQECIKHNLNKVLVDLRELQGENSRVGRFFYLHDIGELHDEYIKAGYPPISVVYVGSSRFISDDGYEEKVSEPYTFNIKTTPDIDEALEWLKSRNNN